MNASTLPPTDDAPISAHEFGVLRWRCRRGMLENDLLIERFFAHRGEQLSRREAQTLTQLMDLSDNDLLDVLLARKPASDFGDAFAMPDMAQLVRMMQAKH